MDREKFDKATEINEAIKAIRLILEARIDMEASLSESISNIFRKCKCSCNVKKGFNFESMKNSMLMIFKQCYDSTELDELKKVFESI